MSLRGVGFFLQCYLMLAAAMYFDLGEQEEKCIIEEIPVDTLVTGESCRGNIFPECNSLKMYCRTASYLCESKSHLYRPKLSIEAVH